MTSTMVKKEAPAKRQVGRPRKQTVGSCSVSAPVPAASSTAIASTLTTIASDLAAQSDCDSASEPNSDSDSDSACASESHGDSNSDFDSQSESECGSEARAGAGQRREGGPRGMAAPVAVVDAAYLRGLIERRAVTAEVLGLRVDERAMTGETRRLWRRVRRMVKNRQSAQMSRQRKREQLHHLHTEALRLHARAELLRSHLGRIADLAAQATKPSRSLLASTSASNSTSTSTSTSTPASASNSTSQAITNLLTAIASIPQEVLAPNSLALFPQKTSAKTGIPSNTNALPPAKRPRTSKR